jgi:hypothetical protein
MRAHIAQEIGSAVQDFASYTSDQSRSDQCQLWIARRCAGEVGLLSGF